MKPVNRRDVLVVGGLAAAGSALVLATRMLTPVGEFVGNTPVVRAALAEPGPEAGNLAGDVTLLVFTDFNCAACRIAHPAMMKAVAADGAVRLRFLDWPVLGNDSRAAARAALAAETQGLYLRVHTGLMTGGRADAGRATALLEAAGGDTGKLAATLATDGLWIDGRLARHAFHAFALGLGGTPAHLAGPVLLRGAAGTRQFHRLFDRTRLERASF